jgi:hypothetical protein
MNNSSDSNNENDNIEINKIKIDAPKKRGRPRKNLFLDKPAKGYEKKEITNDEKDIILHLPVFMGKNKKKGSDEIENKKDTSNEISNSESEEESDDDVMLSGSDDDLSISSDSSDNLSEDKKYKKLYKNQLDEIKKKEIIIKKLKEELDKRTSSNAFDSEVQKDLKTHIINMNLIDNNTNKVIEIKKTDLNCWWDTHPINNYPYFLPEKYYNGKFYVFGWFSSPECAASYNLYLNDYKVMERFALLQKLYGPIKKIAPPKEILKKYGGIVEIEDYRKNFTNCDKEYRLNLPPMVLLNHVIDEITIEKYDRDFNTKSNVTTFSKKKLPMVKNNLFNTMGIKNK